MIIYCLDNSDAACRSEDYPCGNRLAWQLAVVRTVSRSLLAPQQGQQLGNTSNASPQLAVVSSGGRPALSVAPTSDAAALLGLDVSCVDGQRCQFLGALRLALLAVKRSPTGRVLAFLASEADLPAEQCRQLSRNFADARIPLDVVVLSPNDELPPELMTSLQLLTAISVYDQRPDTAETGPGANSQRPGLRRGASGSGPRAALGGQSTERQQELTASGNGSMSSPTPTAVPATAATSEARVQAARAEEGIAAATAVVPPCGQRLLLFPPPEPSLALWQQMEPLLELLQLEVHAGNQQPGSDGEPSTSGVEDDRGVPSQLRTGSGSGRPPLPRPPRYRVTSAAGSTAAAASPSVGQRASSLTPSGPLTSRSGARGATAGTCRYESLDSLQHLSLDGFLRSWLPSYANFSRVLQLPLTAAAQQQQQQGAGAGEAAGGSGAAGVRSTVDADGTAAGLGPGRLCYISVYRLQLPRWHKLCEVHAGCMYEVELPEGSEPSGTGSANAPEGGVASAAAVTAVSPSEPQATAALPPSALARQAVVVPRAPCPVQIHFSTKCSSAAAAVGGDSTAAGSRCHWVYPDLRSGSLSLVASVEDPGVVKLLWIERQRANAQQQPQYGSIFATAEESNDSVEPTAAELELTLSPTRSQFRVVPHAKGGAVLEVLYPRSCVHRPRPSACSAESGSAAQQNAQRAQGGAAQRDLSAASAQTSAQPSHHHNHRQHSQQQQQHHDRYFFWLQQDWQPEVAASGAAAAVPADQGSAVKANSAESGCVREAGSSDSCGTGRRSLLSDRGCRALAEHLQALLECPPEFDPQKHGCRVRCSSTPLQLGPLPFALVEEIMRASGRQLHPDGTLAVATTARSAFSAAAAAASSNHSTAAAGPASTARLQTVQQQQQLQQRQQAGSVRTVFGTQGKGVELCRGAAGVAVLQRDRTVAGQGPDGLSGLALSRSPAGPAGAGAAANSASSAPKCPAGAISDPQAGPPGSAAAGGVGPPGGSGRGRATHLSELRGTVPGFSRTTYSRASAVHDDCGTTGPKVSALSGPEKLTILEAARVLSSHPLDDQDWGSDCDSLAEGMVWHVERARTHGHSER
ncbi:hypothetical protein Vretifemale_6796 [Volvox reticuliferus]|uniref:VWFA domain-containing protein n=1 Tax=Volvox reticuliferus TaxID=1737510 RepID=A0A8J4C835_9CHLO|nr:hypothetical protein Vretifemale_6796 [Volvox reticuliferus]